MAAEKIAYLTDANHSRPLRPNIGNSEQLRFGTYTDSTMFPGVVPLLESAIILDDQNVNAIALQ
jgi:hypothetical protein